MSATFVLAAGGTGGHLFPAEALAAVLVKRGKRVALATDRRAARYGDALNEVHIIPSETVRGRNPVSLAKTAATLSYGIFKALRLLGRVRPAAVIGFGGYPTIPPLMAAVWRRIPTIIHDSNAVMGRANRMLAPRVSAIATSFPSILKDDEKLAAKETCTGNPVRPAVLAAANRRYVAPDTNGPFRILVFGGSQGARVMADVVPPAVENLNPALCARLSIVQQVREEDAARVGETYARLGVKAEIAAFFRDLPERMAAAHLVIARSGGSTVAELATIGRPAILVPLPHALDQDQLANAKVLEVAGGAILITQDFFKPERLASELAALAGATPVRLAAMAQAARSVGAPDAAERLADLVESLGREVRS
jgi:UDP-N-acetylglucosamine--N-acetylmuramyl-(pentapeptide) pyrophosphoryl-undecaprenol N-acetylglucosamine transferase